MSHFKVKGQEFDSPHTNLEAVRKLQEYSAAGKVSGEFPASLLGQFSRKGDLSERQWPYVHLLVWKIEQAGETVADTTPRVIALKASFREVLQQVCETVDKVYDTAAGPVTFSVAGAKAKRPGTINVTDGKGFREGAWFGRIAPNGLERDSAVFLPHHNCPDAVVTFVQMFGEDPVCVSLSYATLEVS